MLHQTDKQLLVGFSLSFLQSEILSFAPSSCILSVTMRTRHAIYPNPKGREHMQNKKTSSRLAEVLRFAVTGGVCFAIEFIVLVLLKELLHMDTLIATPIAFLVSVVFNYLLCVVWVFKVSGDNGRAAKIGFLITSVMGLLFNELFMLIFRFLLGEETVLLTLFGFTVTMYMLNKALSTLLVMIWNYFTKRAMLQSKLFARKR